MLYVLFLGSAMLNSQDNDTSQIINSISIIIDNQAGGEEIEDLITIRPGDLFSIKKINNSIKQIYKTGLFSEIRVLKTEENRPDLTFLLSSRFFVRKIFFQESDGVPGRKLKEGLFSLTEGDSFSESKLKKAVEEIKEALRIRGYFNAGVKVTRDKISDSNQIDIFFEIQSSGRYEVEGIDFEGDLIFSLRKLKDCMATRVGKVFRPKVLEKDIQKLKELYIAEDYQRVNIKIKRQDFNKKKKNVYLVLEILPNEKIEISIKGAEVPLALIKPIWEIRIFEEWGLEEGKSKIIEYLREKRYLFANVDSSIEREDNKIRIIYKVSPGRKCRIEGISFKGVSYFTVDQLEDALSLKDNILFLSKISGSRLFEIPDEIKFLYRTNGFPETDVVLNFERRGAKVKPIFFVEEGKQRNIKTLSVEGAVLFSKARLLKQIDSFEEGPFYSPSIQMDVERLDKFYLNEGVRGSEIKANVQAEDDNLYSVEFQIKEGQKVKIENIIITGNNNTRINTIQRELMIKAGDFAHYNRIRETERRLENLGIFTEVNVEEIILAEGKENLLIRVREGEKNYVGLGVGLETKNEPRSFDIWNNVVRPRGTAEYIRSNIFGTAARVSFVGQLSLKEKRAVFSWEQPYFFGIPIKTFLNAWLEQEERKSYSFDRRGISLSGIKHLSDKEDMVFLTTLRLAQTKLFDLKIAEAGVDRQHFPFSATSISGSFIWDRRSDPFNPGSGFFFSSVLEWAYPLFNAESDFIKSYSKYQHYFLVWPQVLFSVTSRIGLGGGRMPIHERFFAGGSNSFRGAEFDELGPKDAISLEPVGGKALILFNFEVAFPLLSQFKDLSGVIFYDKGNVYFKRSQVSLAGLQDALGFGMRYRTPMGPVRLELGWNLDAPKEAKSLFFFITIGNIF